MLSPMKRAEFDAWRAETIPDHARDKVASGRGSEAESVDKAHALYESLGSATTNITMFKPVR